MRRMARFFGRSDSLKAMFNSLHSVQMIKFELMSRLMQTEQRV